MRFKWLLLSGILGVGVFLMSFSYVSFTYTAERAQLSQPTIQNNFAAQVLGASERSRVLAAQAIGAGNDTLTETLSGVLRQIDGVLQVAAQAIEAIGGVPGELFDIASNDPPETQAEVQNFDPLINAAANQLPAFPAPAAYDGTLIINIPLEVTDRLTVSGVTELSAATIAGVLSVGGAGSFGSVAAGGASLGSLSVSGNTELNTLSVAGPVNFAVVSAGVLNAGTVTVTNALTAQGGLTTDGADIDLEGGNIFAANIVNELIAGDNVEIEGESGSFTISADVPSLGARVRRLNGLSGTVTLVGGSDVSVSESGTNITVANTSDLSTVRARGGCVACLLDADIDDALTIASGTIDNTVIGSTTPAAGTFSSLALSASAIQRFYDADSSNYVGFRASSSIASDLVWTLPDADGTPDQFLFTDGAGNLRFDDVSVLVVVNDLPDLGDVTITTPISGDVLRYDGSQWINASNSALGLGDGTYLGLSDTPDTYEAGAIAYVDPTGNFMTQSSNFVFDGTGLALGTNLAIDILTVDGDIGILNQQELHLYDADSSAYAGFRASSSLASNVIWTLPAVDGSTDQVLVTDGAGNLRFEAVSAVGGGVDTFLELVDTPALYLDNAIPYVATDTLAFSSDLTFDGDTGRLGIGTNAPSADLTVHGSVYFGLNSTNPGLYFNGVTENVSIGSTSSVEKLLVEGGSILQRGGSNGSQYLPKFVGSLSLANTANDIFVVGTRAYVVTSGTSNNFHVVDISDRSDPVILGSEDLPAGALDVYVSGKYAYVVTELLGNDFHVIDISNSSDPVEVGFLELSTTANAVKVRGRYAYVTTSNTPGSDFYVIDVIDPTLPVIVSGFDLNADGNDLVINGDYAFVVTDTPGSIRAIDISDPESIVNVGTTTLATDAISIDSRGDFLFVGVTSAATAFRIYDASDPTNVSLLSSLALTSSANDVYVAGSYAYVVTAGTDEDLHVIDMSSLSTPRVVGSTELATGASFGIKVVGRYAYIVSNTVDDELDIYDITGIEAQTLFAHAIESANLSVIGDIVAAGQVSLAEGLRVGGDGIQSDGSLLIQGSAPSLISGNLAIGTTTAPQTLTVGGSALIEGSLFDSVYNAGTYGQLLMANGVGQVWTSTSSLGLSDAFTTSAELAALLSDETGSAGSVVFSTSPTFTGTVSVGALTASAAVTLSGTAANISLGSNFISGDGDDEGIFITSAGFVGVGTTTPISELSVEGTIMASNLYGVGATLSTDAQGNIIRTPSDGRLKTNVQPIENGLETVLALRGVRYEWLDTARFGEQAEVGFIAQEVELVLPEVVRHGGEYLSLSTPNILAVVIEAIKEMWVTISGQTNQIDELEERIQYLEALLEVETPVMSEESSAPIVSEDELVEADEEIGVGEDTAATTSDDMASQEVDPTVEMPESEPEESADANTDNAGVTANSETDDTDTTGESESAAEIDTLTPAGTEPETPEAIVDTTIAS